MKIYNKRMKTILVLCIAVLLWWGGANTGQTHAAAGEYPGSWDKLYIDLDEYDLLVGTQNHLVLQILYPDNNDECAEYVKENIRITSSESEIVDPQDITDDDIRMGAQYRGSREIEIYFTPKKPGKVTLEAFLGDKKIDDYDENLVDLEVEDAAVISEKELYLSTEGQQTLSLRLPANAEDKGTTWRSDQADIAAVDQNGNVTGVANGTTTITATNGSYSDTCSVTVIKDGLYVDGDWTDEKRWVDTSREFQWNVSKVDETRTFRYYQGGRQRSIWHAGNRSENTSIVEIDKTYNGNTDGERDIIAKGDGTTKVYFSNGAKIIAILPITITGTGVSPDQTKGLRPITEHQGSTYVELLGFNAQNQSYNQAYYENHLNNYVDLKKLAFSFKVASEKPGGANQLEAEQFPQYEELVLSHVNLYEAEGTTLGKKVASWKDGYELQDDPKYGYVAGFEDRGYGQVDMTIVPEAGLLEHDKSYALVFDEEVYAPHKPTSVKKRDKQTIYFFTTKSFVNAASVSLDQSKVSLNQGDTVKLTGTVEPEDSDQTELEWTSSDPAVATVDEQGTVTAVKAGSAMITVKVKETELTGQCQVTVKEKAQTPGTKPTGPTTPPVDTNALDAVKTVKAQANKPNQAAISWEPVSGASGYELWRAESQDGKYERLCAKAAVTYADKGLKSKKTYYYKVRAFQTLEGKTLYSDFSKAVSVKITAKTPVLKAKTGKRQISLSWSKISDADKYELRRSDSKNGVYRKISDQAKNAYLDKGLKSKATYNYKVRAYRMEKGRKIYGPYSKVLTAKAQPEKIAKLTAKAGKKKVKLSWSKVSGADRYELWRADKKNGPYYKVRVTIKQNWTDTKVKAKKTYYYKARAYYLEKGKKIYGNYTPVKKVRTK